MVYMKCKEVVRLLIVWQIGMTALAKRDYRGQELIISLDYCIHFSQKETPYTISYLYRLNVAAYM